MRSVNKNYKLIMVVSFLFCLIACGPIKPNIQKASFKPTANDQSVNRRVISIQIVNKAERGEQITRVLGDSHIPVEPQISTKDIVEDDIRIYFQKRLDLSDTATKSLKIKIKKAYSYYVTGAGDTVPFVGLFTVHSNHPYNLHLDVLFEIEENGKVLKSYDFDEKIILKDGKTAYPSDIEESYTRLIKFYRKEFFNHLDNEFIDRYF